MSETYAVVIVGGGAAGIGAALGLASLGIPHLLVERGELGGQLRAVGGLLRDIPGAEEVEAERLCDLWRRRLSAEGTPVLRTEVAYVDVQPDPEARYTLHLAGNEALRARFLLLATGALPRRLGIPGEDLVPEAYTLSTSRNPERFAGLHVAIVGGGDRALEGGLNLLPHARRITLITRSRRLRGRPAWAKRLLSAEHVSWRPETRLIRIARDADGTLLLTLAPSESPQEVLRVDALLLRLGMAAHVPPLSKALASALERREDGSLRTGEGGENPLRGCTPQAT
ncbi:MAG: NAD(P)/FAD-dependent oxidoreductase [Brockia lithotrophica]|nr:NAD(P)/FAD-dependent oxidoreductase [Brockia lithotrophica]